MTKYLKSVAGASALGFTLLVAAQAARGDPAELKLAAAPLPYAAFADYKPYVDAPIAAPPMAAAAPAPSASATPTMRHGVHPMHGGKP